MVTMGGYLKTVLLFVVLIIAEAALSASEQTESLPPIACPPIGAHNRWPIYHFTQYLHIDKYDIHVLGTPEVSDWMMRESMNLVDQMVGALKSEEDRKKFAGHRNYLVTDVDPSIPGARKGHRNTGGNGFSMFNDYMTCCTSTDTLYPDAKPRKRAWNTPVHEFGHSVEHTLELKNRSDEVFKANIHNYDPKVAREYFAWAVQEWFESNPRRSPREKMVKWKYDYMASVFDEKNTWKPTCSRKGKVYERHKDDTATAASADHPEPFPIDTETMNTAVGEYTHEHPQNDWHRGKITIIKYGANGVPMVLKWANEAGRSWLLQPDLRTGKLNTGSDNPYHKNENGKAFYLVLDQTHPDAPSIGGFWFQGSLFMKTRKTRF
jgi:hypothetical protein